MSSRANAELRCISHGCLVWDGRPLPPEDIRALMIAHAIVHLNRLFTPADMFGEQEPE